LVQMMTNPPSQAVTNNTAAATIRQQISLIRDIPRKKSQLHHVHDDPKSKFVA
jgi:hypothetical protein